MSLVSFLFLDRSSKPFELREMFSSHQSEAILGGPQSAQEKGCIHDIVSHNIEDFCFSPAASTTTRHESSCRHYQDSFAHLPPR